LVTVLWVLVLLSLIAASFTYTTRTQVNLTRNQIENAEAEALADAGVYRAILALLSPRTEGLLDRGMENLLSLGTESAAVARRKIEESLRREMQAGNLAPEAEALFREGWRADGTVYAWALGGTEVRISIQDESGKIDLNGADDALLRGLFLAAEWTDPDGEIAAMGDRDVDALVDAVRDYADEDDLTRLNGAEDRDYAAAGLPWDAKDAPFEAVEELQQVLGMTPLLYEAVAPTLTVHTGQEGIDANVAPRAVLLALPGTDAEAVESYLSARAGAPEGGGPTFVQAESFGTRSRSRFFTLRAESRLENGAIYVREAVVALGGRRQQPYRLLSWKRGSLLTTPPPHEME
jgi:general secretion pathway protein K